MEITPYDQVEMPSGTACTQELQLIAHNASMAFTDAGANTLIVHGQTKAGSGDTAQDLSFTVSVQ